MANESKFKAGQMYGAEDINNTMAILTDGGVFNVTTPNEICASISGEGITGQDGKLEVTITDGKVHVANGTCIMADGSTFTVYGDGESLDYSGGEINYVYVENDPLVQKNILKCTTAEPTASDIIALAVINANNTVTDKRTFAKSKIEKIGSNATETILLDFKFSTPSSSGVGRTPDKSISINERYNFMAIIFASDQPQSYLPRDTPDYFIRLSDGKVLGWTQSPGGVWGDGNYTMEWLELNEPMLRAYETYLPFTIKDRVLTFEGGFTRQAVVSSVSVELILM